MRKQALIISNPGETGSSGYCEGVNKDVVNYKNFLKQPSGGLWYESEIRHLPRPSASEVRNAIKQLKDVDYSLVIFSGHGYYSARTESTVLVLRKDEEINSMELRNGSLRQTLILDCCREVAKELAKAFEEYVLKAARAAFILDPGKCRLNYEKQIEGCNSGLIVAHACKVGETAQDSSAQGGYYSYSFLRVASGWVEAQRSPSVFSAPSAHDVAVPLVIEWSGQRQHPQIEKPRTEKHFPIAVVA